MPSIEYEGTPYEASDGESVLACLLRHGVSVGNSCRSGVCQSCVLRAEAGAIPARSQVGLKPTLKMLGYLLACVCEAAEGLRLVPVDAAQVHEGEVESVERLGPSVVRVFVRVRGELRAQPGQFVQLVRREDGLTRPYSVANLQSAGLLELHVAVLPGGRMSNWLAHAAGKSVGVRGPSGDCFYVPGRGDAPLILAGTGTGLAPLLGVLRAALAAQHQGPIYLYHGSPRSSSLYLREELRALARANDNLRFVASALVNDDGAEDVRVLPLEQAVLGDHPRLDGTQVFLCGAPDLVRNLRKRAYLAGAALEDIHSDAFVVAPA